MLCHPDSRSTNRKSWFIIFMIPTWSHGQFGLWYTLFVQRSSFRKWNCSLNTINLKIAIRCCVKQTKKNKLYAQQLLAWASAHSDQSLCCRRIDADVKYNVQVVMSVRPSKTQISLCIRGVWSGSPGANIYFSFSLYWQGRARSLRKVQRFFGGGGGTKIPSDQTVLVRRLIWIFALDYLRHINNLLGIYGRVSLCWTNT